MRWLGWRVKEDGTIDKTATDHGYMVPDGERPTVEEILDAVAKDLGEQAKAEIPERNRKLLDDLLRPVEKFQEKVKEKVRQAMVHADQFRLAKAEAIFRDPRLRELQPLVYRRMMEAKIENLAYEAEHRLRNVLRTSLEEVKKRIFEITAGGNDVSTDATDPEVYKAFSAKLEELHQKITVFAAAPDAAASDTTTPAEGPAHAAV